MRESQRLERNRSRLEECYPVFAEALKAAIDDLESLGFRPRIQDAWRSPATQLEAVNRGNSELKFGFHNVTGAGGRKESLAVDLLDDDAPLEPARRYLLTLAAIAREHGLETGVLWGLQRLGRDRVNRAIRERDFDTPVKIGWDPCHVQITGMTATQAKQGQRPTAEILRAAVDEARPTPQVAPPRNLLVRRVDGPARSRAGEGATYRAVDFNLADPTIAEKSTINWAIRIGDRTVAEFRENGDVLDLDIAADWAGKTIQVMPFRNSPTPRVSVVTRIEAIESPDMTAGDSGVASAAKVIRFEREGARYFATVNGGPRFFVGTDVRYQSRRGLMNTRDDTGIRYDPADYRGRFGFWADFIYPTASCESQGYFHRLNSYDRAAFTFGFFQFAAHTPNDNFVLLLRQLLATPLAPAYFPDLVVHDGAVHRIKDQQFVRLEDADSTAGLMAYLNPGSDVVDDREVITAAKFIHWSLNDPSHRELQVAFTVDQMQKKMAGYARRYRLEGMVDTICLVVADIRHQGRARSTQIIEALESQNALESLLSIGEDGFPDRIATLRNAIAAGQESGVLGARRYDSVSREFVPL